MNDTKKKIVELDLNDVLPNRFQPRIKFMEDSILELSESIKTHGLLQPIIVRPIGDKYEIIAGERRYKACVIAGLDTISSIIIDYNDKDSAEVALIENVQRRDLTAIEEAISYKKILDMGYLTQEQLASKLGKSQSSIANKIRLLNLCDEVQEALMEEKISERHARSLLKLKNSIEQRYMLKKIIKERLTVRKSDTEIQKILDGEIAIDEVENSATNENLSEKTNIDHANDDIIVEQKAPADSSDDDMPVEQKELVDSSDDDITDITNLFDEAKLEEFLNQISLLDDENKKSDENKKEENDKMMNDSNFNNDQTKSSGRFFNIQSEEIDNKPSPGFVINNNDQTISTNRFDELLAPQGNNSPSIHVNNQGLDNSIFSSNHEINSDTITTIERKNSMFSNLLNSSPENTQDDVVDKETFGKFLDPTYVDGNKTDNSASLDSSVDNSVFAKFLDPDYGGKTEIKDNNISKDFNSIFNVPKENTVETKNEESMSSNNFNSIFNSSNTNIEKKDEIASSGNDFNLIFNAVPANNEIEKETPNSSFNLLQTESISDNHFNPEEQLAIYNSNSQNKAPDLLAPMGSIKEDNTSNIFEKSSINETISNSTSSNPLSLDDTIFGQLGSNLEVSRQEGIETQLPTVETLEFKQPEIKQLESEELDSVQQEILNQAPTQLVPTQNPIEKKFENQQNMEKPLINNQDSIQSETKQLDDLVSAPDNPIFITASNSSQDNLMPENPIIDNPDVSKLLSVDSVQSTIESVEEPVEVPSTISETISNEPEIKISGPIGNQPIIVTDYNKQYDPIFPETSNKESQVDLRQIINMIRELSDKIESYGYTIDTEEIDLADSYQVIFNIEKK